MCGIAAMVSSVPKPVEPIRRMTDLVRHRGPDDEGFLIAPAPDRPVEAYGGPATPGPYGGILEAHRHYIALEPDCSNAPDVVAQMSDRTLVARIRADARAAVLDRPELRASTQAASLIEQIASGAAGKRAPSTPSAQMDATVARYRRDVVDQADLFWRHRRRRLRLRNILVALGARKIKRWLTRVD